MLIGKEILMEIPQGEKLTIMQLKSMAEFYNCKIIVDAGKPMFLIGYGEANG